MAKVPTPRDSGPIIQMVRKFLLGRKHTNNLRFQAALSERPGPPANLPEGPSHKLSANYYHTRDGRREVAPPTVLADGTQKVIASGEGAAASSAVTQSKTPGRVYNYSQSI